MHTPTHTASFELVSSNSSPRTSSARDLIDMLAWQDGYQDATDATLPTSAMIRHL
jgi:hypothetical protein